MQNIPLKIQITSNICVLVKRQEPNRGNSGVVCVNEGGYSASEIRSTGELKWEVAGAEQVLKYLTTLLDEESTSSS